MARRKEEVKIRGRSLLAVGPGRRPLWFEHRSKWEVSHEMRSEVSPEAGSPGTSQHEQSGAHPGAVGTRGRWDQCAVSSTEESFGEREERAAARGEGSGKGAYKGTRSRRHRRNS